MIALSCWAHLNVFALFSSVCWFTYMITSLKSETTIIQWIFFFFIKCMQSMTMTLSRRCMYAKLHVIWSKSLLYIFSLINHIDSLRIRARELSIWSSDHIDNSKLWKLITSTWAFDLSVWSITKLSRLDELWSM